VNGTLPTRSTSQGSDLATTSVMLILIITPSASDRRKEKEIGWSSENHDHVMKISEVCYRKLHPPNGSTSATPDDKCGRWPYLAPVAALCGRYHDHLRPFLRVHGKLTYKHCRGPPHIG